LAFADTLPAIAYSGSRRTTDMKKDPSKGLVSSYLYTKRGRGFDYFNISACKSESIILVISTA